MKTVAQAFRHTAPNGSLFAFDADSLPITVQRVFFVVAPTGSRRGGHAHRECQQFLTVVSGSVLVELTTWGAPSNQIELQVGEGLLIPALVWAQQTFLEPNSILVVLCDQPYLESDYIRDFDLFEKMA